MRFMRCNGLPNAYDPGDLRNYMHMWQLEAHNASATERNWLLNVNERTVLTQNLKAANATRVHLQQQQPVLGDSYAMRIRHVLGVCIRIFGLCCLYFRGSFHKPKNDTFSPDIG